MRCDAAGICCENDVGSTSMRRHHVAPTLIRRHFGTKCSLGIQCDRSSYCTDNLFIIYLFPQKEYLFKSNYAGTSDDSCGMFSDVISLVLRDSDTDSESVILIPLSVSDHQKTCSSKGVSSIRI